MADATDAAAAAATAAAETTAAVASVQAAADAAIEHAENRTAAAQEAANQLADAVVATELGRRVSAVESEYSKCLSEIANLRSTSEIYQTEVKASLASLTSQITEMAAKLLTPQPLQTPQPNQSEEPIAEVTTELPVEAVENAAAISEESAAPVVKKLKRVWR